MANAGVYVLELEGGRIYVGSSEDISRRIAAHEAGSGSQWTQKHRPVRRIAQLLSPPEESMQSRELAETCHWAKRRGVEKVRGAHWCRVSPTPAEVEDMTKTVRHFFNLCFVCGREGHFATRCEEKSTRDGDDVCARCGRRGHAAPQCYARTRTDKPSPLVCYRCGRRGHAAPQCYAKTCIDKEPLVCYRCGRPGHTAPQCYARTCVDGEPIDGDWEWVESWESDSESGDEI